MKLIAYDDGYLGHPRKVGCPDYEYPFQVYRDVDAFLLTENFKMRARFYTPLLPGTAHPLHNDAHLIEETKGDISALGVRRFQRRWIRMPAVEHVTYPSMGFDRPIMDDIVAGGAWAVSLDGGNTSHIFATRKAVAALSDLDSDTKAVAGTVPRTREDFAPDVFDGSHTIFISDGLSSTTVTLTTAGVSIAAALETFFSTDVTVVISTTVCQITFGKEMEVFDVSSAELDLSGSPTLVTVKRIQSNNYNETTDAPDVTETYAVPASERALTIVGHGFSVGDLVPLWLGDKVVARTYCYRILDADTITVPRVDVDGQDFACNWAQKASAGVRYVNGMKNCDCRETYTYYRPGYTPGIADEEDIPLVDARTTPIQWMTELIAGTDWIPAANSEKSEIYPGLYMRKKVELSRADAVETVPA